MIDIQSVAHSVFCAPLPAPALSRQLMLVARSGEMGGIPARIAELTRRVLETRCAPEIGRMFPWLGDSFKVGDT
jgi:hypothetical protein